MQKQVPGGLRRVQPYPHHLREWRTQGRAGRHIRIQMQNMRPLPCRPSLPCHHSLCFLFGSVHPEPFHRPQGQEDDRVSPAQEIRPFQDDLLQAPEKACALLRNTQNDERLIWHESFRAGAGRWQTSPGQRVHRQLHGSHGRQPHIAQTAADFRHVTVLAGIRWHCPWPAGSCRMPLRRKREK